MPIQKKRPVEGEGDHLMLLPWSGVSLPIQWLVFFAGYLLCAWVSVLVAKEPGLFPLVWLPAGLFAAALLSARMRDWHGFLLAGFAAAACFDLRSGYAMEQSFTYAIADVSGALVSVLVARVLWKAYSANDDVIRPLLLLGACLLGGPAISATIGVLATGGGLALPLDKLWLIW